MFDKLLIANRGEIACRVIRSAKRMGIQTVAVFSDADRDAPHVQMADEAVHIGASPSAESYLLVDRIIEACRSTGAEAVHPGYGFLSEKSALVLGLEKAGIAFVGPPAKAIEIMGDKIASKALAESAGVPTIPGFNEVLVDAQDAVSRAWQIGYPVMLKATPRYAQPHPPSGHAWHHGLHRKTQQPSGCPCAWQNESHGRRSHPDWR